MILAISTTTAAFTVGPYYVDIVVEIDIRGP